MYAGCDVSSNFYEVFDLICQYCPIFLKITICLTV